MISDELLEKLQKEHGDIKVVETVLGPVAFRTPKRSEYKMHLAMLFDEKKRPEAVEILARMCVVHPDRQAFDQMIERKPGIPLACASALSELAGVQASSDEKK